MKCLLQSSALIALLLVSSLATEVDALRTRSISSSSPFASLRDEANNFAGLTLSQYVGRLEQSLRFTSSMKSEHSILVQHLNYYRSLMKMEAIHESHRNHASGTVHDCVPFHLQPALFSATQAEIDGATEMWMKATNGGKKSAEAVCTASNELPVPRPILKFGDDSFPKLKVAPAKSAKKNLGASPPPGYSYVDSAFANVSAGTNFTYTILGVGEGVKSHIPTVPFLNEQDHSINQMWWVDKTKNPYDLKTLEAGWINCAYWSFFAETQLFVFSTPDGYQGSKYDQYNYAGDFIGYPGAPALQKGVDSVQYLWKYEIMGEKKGYEMKLTPFGNNTAMDGYAFKEEIPVGYFPMKRYLPYSNGTIPNFNVLQTGQELDQSANSSALHAGGKIFGWGTDTERYPIKGNFTDFGNPIAFSYGTSPYFKPATKFTGSHFVEFHGDDCGTRC